MTTAATSWIIFQRSMRYTLRKPSWVIFGLMQPLLYLALFGPLLSRIGQAPGFEGATPGGSSSLVCSSNRASSPPCSSASASSRRSGPARWTG